MEDLLRKKGCQLFKTCQTAQDTSLAEISGVNTHQKLVVDPRCWFEDVFKILRRIRCSKSGFLKVTGMHGGVAGDLDCSSAPSAREAERESTGKMS